MQNIIFLGIPFLLENIYYASSVRKFYKQILICKMLPAVFTNFSKIIISSVFAKKSNNHKFYHIFTLTIIYESFACLSVFHSTQVTGIYYAVALNSKFIFISLLSYFMLRKRFTPLQILGQCIIFVAICSGGCNTATKDEADAINTTISFLAIVFSGLMSSLGNVYFEKYIRHGIDDFYTYNLDYSTVHFFVSMCTAIVEVLAGEMVKVTNTVSDYRFYNCIFVSVLHTYLLTFISTKTEPIVRSFLVLVVSNLTSIVIDYVEMGVVKGKPIITLGIVNLGIILYEFDNLKKLYARKGKKEVNTK